MYLLVRGGGMRFLVESWTGLLGRARDGLISVLPVPGLRLGAERPSMVSSPLARLCWRWGSEFLRKGTRLGLGDFTSFVVKNKNPSPPIFLFFLCKIVEIL